jgi:hypothetical protein
MPFSRITRPRGAAIAIVAFLLGAVRAYPLEAQAPTASQQPQQPATTSAVLAPYRAPVLALVQPATGTVTQDKPVVVFRFAQGEPTDPLDLASFAVSVDGEDRTALFQVATGAAGGDAWGPLDPPGDDALTVGAHQVVARICSTRGACASAASAVIVMPPLVQPAADATPDEPRSRKRKLLDAVLSAGRKLLLLHHTY